MHKYEIIKELDSSTGVVINLCKKDNQLVVIKESTHPDYFENLNDELTILSQLSSHKHIIQIQESFIFGQKIYIEYEYYQNGDLYDYIKNNGILDEPTVLQLLTQLVSALIYAKEVGYYHCDIKPENILLRSSLEYVLSDWDLAKKIENSSVSLNYGSGLSMAPEVILGQYCDTSDIYSLGCLVYFCLFGKRVFDLKTSEPKHGRILKHLEEDVTFPKNNMSNNFHELVKLMLYKNPKRRVTLEEIQDYLNGKNIILRFDECNICENLNDFINNENKQKNKIKSLQKYEKHKKEFEENKSESSKSSMLAHLIVLSYLGDKESQNELISFANKNELVYKDLEIKNFKELRWK
jgi:serine/threonine protein kinase